MANLKFEPKESVISALSWSAYAGTVLLTKDRDAADAAKSAVESLGGIVSIQEKDSISKKVSGFCKKAWILVLKKYGAEALKSELQNYNFAHNPFYWDNTLTIQARIIAACKKKKIHIIHIPYKKISESVVIELSKMMDDDPTLKQLFLLTNLSKDKKYQSTEIVPIPETSGQTLTIIPAPSKLLGRDKAISDIREMLKSSEIVCIHADGGVGKTAVAAVIMDEIRSGCAFKHFAWITSSGSLKKDLSLLNVPIASELHTDEEKTNAVIRFLQEHPTFIVIDNMDDPLDSQDRALLNTLKGKTKILVTSRIALENMKPFNLEQLEPRPALEYFYRCYLGEWGHTFEKLNIRKDAKYVQLIIKAATYNALLIELIGKMARWEFPNKLDDLWKKIRDNIFIATSKIDIDSEHSVSHSLNKKDLKLHNQIRRLYTLSGLPERCREIMGFMAQFPAEMNVFKELLDWADFDINDIKWLTDRAWIEQTHEGYLLHTMVRGSVWTQEIKFDIWQYRNLIDKLGHPHDYMPASAGYVTVRKRLNTVGILSRLIVDDIEVKLKNTERNKWALIDASVFLNNLAGVYHVQGNYEEAQRYYQKAMLIFEKVLGEDHPDTAMTYNNLASLYKDQGNYEEALKLYWKALLIREKALGEDHPDTAATFDNIAGLYEDQGNYEEALTFYWKALLIRKKVLGEEHPATVATYNNLAAVYKDQGNYEEALKFFQKTLVVYEKIFGENHHYTGAIYNNLASVYCIQGNYEEALKFFQKALVVYEKVLGEDHPDTANTYNNLASMYTIQENNEDAQKYYWKALVIRKKVLGEEHPETGTTYDNIAAVYRNQGNYEEALKYYQKALLIHRKVFGEEHPRTGATYNNLALLYQDQGNNEEALKFFLKALEIFEKKLGKEHPDTGAAYTNIADVYGSQGKNEEALEYFQKALMIHEKILGKEHLTTAMTYNNMGNLFFSMNDYIKADDHFRKALSIFEKALGNDHPTTVRERKIVELLETLELVLKQ